MITAGIDEAALGPSLGPFCAVLTRFDCEKRFFPDKSLDLSPSGSSGGIECGSFRPLDLYKELSDSVSAEKSLPERIWVQDSKKLYRKPVWRPGGSLFYLEDAALSFLCAAGMSVPPDFYSLVEALAPPEDVLAMKETPWFSAAEEMSLPFCRESGFGGMTLTARARSLKKNLSERGISFLRPRLRIVTAAAFNRLIVEKEGKSGAVQSILTPLISKNTRGYLTVDRQGGRRYYCHWLKEVFPGINLQVIEESPASSLYRLENPEISSSLAVEFLVKADSLKLEAALASIIAKYVRELAMLIFNRWWSLCVPGIRPTAGYPQDARRFIKDVETAGAMPENPDILVRRL